MQDAIRFSIAEVVERTQVPADTIRSWERRYGRPNPVRTDGNRRAYSEEDIQQILELRSREKPVSLAPTPRIVEKPVAPQPKRSSAEARHGSLTSAYHALDWVAAEDAVTNLMADTTPAKTVTMILNAQDGLEGAAAAFGVTHARAALLRLIPGAAADDSPLVIIAAERPDPGELRLLGTAVLLGFEGWRVLPLGTVSRETVEHVIAEHAPKLVLLAGALPAMPQGTRIATTDGYLLPADPAAAVERIKAGK